MNTEVQETIPTPESTAYKQAMTTAGILGLRLSDEQKAVLRSLPSLALMNTRLVEWRNTPVTRHQFTEEELDIFRSVGNVRTTQGYKDLLYSVQREEDSIAAKTREIEGCINRMRNSKERLAVMDLIPTTGVTEEVYKILELGFFKLESIAHNKLTFRTNAVVCSHIDKSIGVDLRVPMGSYLIQIDLQSCTPRVYEGEDNLQCWGNIHPHVSSSNEVCWGNAKNTYYKARAEFKLATIMIALYQILQTYNPESPYCPLVNFAFARDPGMVQVWYRKEGTSVELDTEYNDEYDEETEDDNNDTIWIYSGYQACAKGTNNALSDEIYIKDSRQPSGFINVRATGTTWRQA